MVTRRQKELLDYVRSHIASHGYAPTLEEIGRRFGLASVATVHKHLRGLEQKGLLRRLSRRSRALEVVTRETTPAVAVPFLGLVAAGAPIEAIEGGRETMTLPEELLGRGETFALRVRGDSMVDEGILDGDVLVVAATASAENGATVVALVRGDATVKKFYRERGRVRLVPANARMRPILVRADEVQIRGKVIAVIRRFR